MPGCVSITVSFITLNTTSQSCGRCHWLVLLLFAFEETKLNKNPLSLNWTWQPKYLDWSDLALCGDRVCWFTPRETGMTRSQEQCGGETNKFYFQKRWNLEKLWDMCGGDKKNLACNFTFSKNDLYTLFLCSWILHCLPFSCDLLKALHRYFSAFSCRSTIPVRNVQHQTVTIRDVFNTLLTSTASF